MKKTSSLFYISLVFALVVILFEACATKPAPNWEEATGYGVIPPWRKPGEGRLMARNVAIKEAKQKLFDYVCNDPVEGISVQQMALMSPSFKSRVITMLSNPKIEEIPNQPEGIVQVKAKIDRNEVARLAKKYGPKKVRVTTPAIGIPVTPTATPQAPAATPQAPIATSQIPDEKK